MRVRPEIEARRDNCRAHNTSSNRAEEKARRIMDKAVRGKEDEKGPQGHSESQSSDGKDGEPKEEENTVTGVSETSQEEDER